MTHAWRPRPPWRTFDLPRFEDVFSTLPFYLGRPLPVIDSASRDLQFGCQRTPGSTCITAGQFRRLRQHGPVAVAVRAGRAAEFLDVAGRRRMPPQNIYFVAFARVQ